MITSNSVSVPRLLAEIVVNACVMRKEEGQMKGIES